MRLHDHFRDASDLDLLREAGATDVQIARVFSQCDLPFDGDAESPFAALDLNLFCLCTSRSGSTFLGQLLGAHEQLPTMKEYLTSPSLALVAKRTGAVSINGCIAATVRENGTDGAFASKSELPGAVRLAQFGELSSPRANLRLIYLYRENIAAQAVSVLKAKLSGRWHSFQEKDREIVESDYDLAALTAAAKATIRKNATFAKLVTLVDCPTLVIKYEDLAANTDAVMAGVGDFLGLPGFDAINPKSVKSKKLANRRSGRWEARFRADVASELSL